MTSRLLPFRPGDARPRNAHRTDAGSRRAGTALLLGILLLASCSDSDPTDPGTADGTGATPPSAPATGPFSPAAPDTGDATPPATTPPDRTPDDAPGEPAIDRPIDRPVDRLVDAPAHAPTDPMGQDGGQEAAPDPFVPTGALLPGLLPDRTRVFSEPIADVPDPDHVVSDGPLLWNYRLAGDQLVSDAFEPPLSQRRVWQRFAELIPAELRSSMETVTFSVDPRNEFAYPQAFVSAYGFTTVPGEQRTSLGMNEALVVETLDGIDAGYGTHAFDRLATHEFAHILQADDALEGVGNEPVYFRMLGLSYRRDSLMGAFLTNFWEGEVERVWRRSQAEPGSARRLYEAFPGAFVTEYAATNQLEDFAESFEHFVSFDGPPESGDLPGAAKVRFFWERPDMVALRERLRALR